MRHQDACHESLLHGGSNTWKTSNSDVFENNIARIKVEIDIRPKMTMVTLIPGCSCLIWAQGYTDQLIFLTLLRGPRGRPEGWHAEGRLESRLEARRKRVLL